ncbi:MAG: acyltransferase [Lachnospiraceae bacterium]|nr:acyltransferase [Lachnospiraceae bacterium]
MNASSDTGKQVSPAFPRNTGIDMLRILSMFLIVILHVLGQGGAMVRVSSHPSTYQACWFLETCAFCAVNCYGLISGYVGGGTKLRVSRLLYLWMVVWFYSVIIALLFLAFAPEMYAQAGVPKAFSDLFIGSRTYWILKILFPVSMKNYWYFSGYAALFFLMPFINRAVSKMGEQECRTVLKVLFIVFSVWTAAPKAISSDFLNLTSGYTFVWLLMLYLAGACIRKSRFPGWKKGTCVLIFFVCVLFSWGWKMIVEDLTRASLGKAVFGRVFMTYTAPTIVLCGAALLILFSKLEIRGRILTAIVRFLAPLSFSVYIIHTHPLIWECVLKGAFRQYSAYGPVQVIPAVLVTALAIFLICSLLDFARLKLFELLRIRKMCVLIEGKLTGRG